MSNIFGLFGSRNNDDADPNATENYSGGQSSGMATLNPGSADSAFRNAERVDGPVPDGSSRVQIWRNGYIVDDGPFCPLGVPEHDAFMNAIMKGNKPASLQAGTVVLSDHRHEEYKPTGQAAAAPAVQLFSGEGRQLQETVAVTVNASAGNDDVEADGVIVHVIFPDGSSGKLVLKKDGTVQDVYNKVKEKISVDGGVIHIALASCRARKNIGDQYDMNSKFADAFNPKSERLRVTVKNA